MNLKAGDRIGHALALGIDVDLYYKHRNHRVVMSKQNMLDNAAWLHHKARELGIQLSVNVALELENIFENFYDEIYLGKRSGKEKIYLLKMNCWILAETLLLITIHGCCVEMILHIT